MVHGAAGSTGEGTDKHYWSPAKERLAISSSARRWNRSTPYRDYVTIVSDTDLHPATAWAAAEEGADHFRSSAVYLTAAHPKMTEGSDYFVGTSLDQLYAQQFGQDTPLPSIQLCIEMVDASGACDYGYACVYADTISWASPTTPLPMTLDPRMAFENLFGEGGTPEERAARQKVNSSILDWISHDVTRLQKDLGAERPQPPERLSRRRSRDRAPHPAHREIQLQRRGPRPARRSARRARFVRRARAADVRPAGAGLHDRHHPRLRLQDEPRRQRPRLAGKRREDSVPSLLASRRDPDASVAEFAKLNRYHVSLLPYFLEKLKNTPDGDGNLLDHSMVLYGSPMGDSNVHNHKRVPLVDASATAAAIKGNLHIATKDGTPMANVLLTMAQKLGVKMESFGDSNGTIAI